MFALPRHNLSLRGHLQVHAKMGDYEQSLEFARRAVAVDPVNTKALFRKATALRSLRRYELAARQLEKVSAFTNLAPCLASTTHTCCTPPPTLAVRLSAASWTLPTRHSQRC